LLLPTLLLLASLLIGVAAIGDHHWKRTRMNRAELDSYYCTHRGTRCGRGNPDRIEAAWNERQLGYEIAVAVTAATGLVLLARDVRRRGLRRRISSAHSP
jgi:hypothetical protein